MSKVYGVLPRSRKRARALTIAPLLAFLVAALLFPLSPAIGAGHQGALPAAPGGAAQTLSLSERVACQKAIEAVSWARRIWPAENPDPKPRLEQILPQSAIQARVDDDVRKSKALDILWDQPLSGAQLQAEIERMSRGTQQPGALQELWQALDGDPRLVAECLARPLLADRLLRSWYAQDNRFHGALRARAESDLAQYGTITGLRQMSGAYREEEWTLQQEAAPAQAGSVRPLPALEWDRRLEQLSLAFHGSEPVAGGVSPLQEDADRFYVVAILEKNPQRVRLAVVEWLKQPFDQWWAVVRDTLTPQVDAPAYAYRLPLLRETVFQEDDWTPTAGLPEGYWESTVVWTGSEMIVWGGTEAGASKFNTGSRYDPATDTWTPTSGSGAPMPRKQHAAVWTGTEMIVWGGCGMLPQHFCEIFSGGRYDPMTDTWQATSLTGVPSARLVPSAVWTGSEMIIWGGCGFSNDFCTPSYIGNSGGRYNPDTDTWTATSIAGAPVGRFYHTAVWTGSQMIVWGGGDGLGPINTGGRYDPAADTWTPTSMAAAPEARSVHSAVWTGSEMIVWGGAGVGGLNVLNTGGRYDPIADSWLGTPASGAPIGRYQHTAVWTDHEMIVWGGFISGGSTNSGGRYDPSTDSWTPTSLADAPSARGGHLAVWTGTQMVVWGAVLAKTGGRYDPISDTWTPTSTNDPFTAKAYHTAIWTGSEMIIWGGEDRFGGIEGTGARYDPVTDTWQPTSLVNSPAYRSFHTAIWTGSEMIVWGGQYGTYTYNDGGRYNPLTDSWTPTSISGAPTGRALHSAVWTGSEMIVWGGSGDVYYQNTGGRYNPLTDAWLPTTTTNAPVGRYIHAALWTGDQMIVWGGAADGSFPSSGGRYDPAADAWSPTSLTDPPAGRYFFTALWTGTQMLVWGGRSGIGPYVYFNSGARYDPVADAWTPTSLVAAPEARAQHSGVWTGTEMIVWGGCTSGYACLNGINTGGRYDPAADSWTATSVIGAPGVRNLHTAVWAGSEMIVWGGVGGDSSTYTSTGGRYHLTGQNQPPAAADDSATTVQDTAAIIDVAANDTDPNGNLDASTADVLTQPGFGTAAGNGDGTITYTPDAGWFGTDSFTYEICDTGGLCDEAMVTAEVTRKVVVYLPLVVRRE